MLSCVRRLLSVTSATFLSPTHSQLVSFLSIFSRKIFRGVAFIGSTCLRVSNKNLFCYLKQAVTVISESTLYQACSIPTVFFFIEHLHCRPNFLKNAFLPVKTLNILRPRLISILPCLDFYFVVFFYILTLHLLFHNSLPIRAPC